MNDWKQLECEPKKRKKSSEIKRNIPFDPEYKSSLNGEKQEKKIIINEIETLFVSNSLSLLHSFPSHANDWKWKRGKFKNKWRNKSKIGIKEDEIRYGTMIK